MAAWLYVLAGLLALVVAVMEVRAYRRVRPTPADQIRPVRYLTLTFDTENNREH
jgi:hypothetical protein